MLSIINDGLISSSRWFLWIKTTFFPEVSKVENLKDGIETKSPRDEKFRLFIGREVKAFFDIFFFPSCFCFLLKRVGLSCAALAIAAQPHCIKRASSILLYFRQNVCKLLRTNFQSSISANICREIIDLCRFSMHGRGNGNEASSPEK